VRFVRETKKNTHRERKHDDAYDFSTEDF